MGHTRRQQLLGTGRQRCLLSPLSLPSLHEAAGDRAAAGGSQGLRAGPIPPHGPRGMRADPIPPQGAGPGGCGRSDPPTRSGGLPANPIPPIQSQIRGLLGRPCLGSARPLSPAPGGADPAPLAIKAAGFGRSHGAQPWRTTCSFTPGLRCPSWGWARGRYWDTPPWAGGGRAMGTGEGRSAAPALPALSALPTPGPAAAGTSFYLIEVCFCYGGFLSFILP